MCVCKDGLTLLPRLLNTLGEVVGPARQRHVLPGTVGFLVRLWQQ